MAERLIAFIPARGGSKSIPLKNIKPLAGKPLVHWTIEAALDCAELDRVYLCTDSEAIREAVAVFADHPRFAVVGRSPEVSSDTASTEAVMLEFAAQHEFEDIMLIQATSPLLTSDDLKRGIEKYRRPELDSVLSVVRQKRFLWRETADGAAESVNYDIRQRPRRQEFDGLLVENGAFYLTSREALLRESCRLAGRIGVVELDEASYVELDEPADWILVEQLLLGRERDESRLAEKARRIRLFISDVDGVLTDAGMYYAENGDELKKFNTRDGMGFQLLREAGFKTAIVTSENTELVARRANKLKLDFVRQGVADKAACVTELIQELGFSFDEVCFIGDDINDSLLLEKVGLPCCPADAAPPVKLRSRFLCRTKGGAGCVRELADYLLAVRK